LPRRVLRETEEAGLLPAVGDWVAWRPEPAGERAFVEAVLPRRSSFSRKAAWTELREQVVAANVDVVLLVQAVPDDFNVRRLERYLTTAWDSGASPAVVLTKTDLVDVVEIAAECRFHDCAHEQEPGCAVREALASGRLSAERWESYGKQLRELRALQERLDVHARKERVRQYRIRARAMRKGR